MTETKTDVETGTPATIEQIKFICEGAPAEFVLEMIEAQATIEKAMEAYMDRQGERIKELESRVGELEQENHTLTEKQKKTSVKSPVALSMTSGHGKTDVDETDVVATWNARIDAEVKSGKTKANATRELIAAEPDLHEEFIAEYTKRHAKK